MPKSDGRSARANDRAVKLRQAPVSTSGRKTTKSTPDVKEDYVLTAVDTAALLLQNIGLLLEKLPYVRAVGGLVNQLVQIRREMKRHERRSKELADEVLRLTEFVVEELKEISDSPDAKENGKLKRCLEQFETILKDITENLEKREKRKGILKMLDRGLDWIKESERKIKAFESSFEREVVRGVSKDIKLLLKHVTRHDDHPPPYTHAETPPAKTSETSSSGFATPPSHTSHLLPTPPSTVTPKKRRAASEEWEDETPTKRRHVDSILLQSDRRLKDMLQGLYEPVAKMVECDVRDERHKYFTNFKVLVEDVDLSFGFL